MSDDQEVYDETVIDAADRLLRAALRGYTFRLAVQCDVCGIWLTDPKSVRRHRGPVCAKKDSAA
ncbi:DUF6011 domain-containing protein [Rhodococcus sp. IEGM 1343]|uniref:DUF6011 domain-containing protein n=1 Tax=Rhodococcus sp. IEGM 1343 TaxID=3082224 RepID=UPI002954ABFB|nr:DUF6011 domain-containing protein [Rhodococcus sp. IEGM 1343]MDV8058244.1 DUF6011 domain-containing protein [Rhodococcus sp. IEGM 1343]